MSPAEKKKTSEPVFLSASRIAATLAKASILAWVSLVWKMTMCDIGRGGRVRGA